MKTFTPTKAQIKFIAKVEEAIQNAKTWNYTIKDTSELYNTLMTRKKWLKDLKEYWTNQRPLYAKEYRRLYKRYGYVDKKLFAKCFYELFKSLERYQGSNKSMNYIRFTWNALQDCDKYLLCYELAKTFKK